MSARRRAAGALVALAVLGGTAACGGDDVDTSTDPVEVEVGKSFSWNGFTVDDGWTLKGVERSVNGNAVTTPNVEGSITNTLEEERAAIFEMVFSDRRLADRHPQLLGGDDGPGPVPAVRVPGPQRHHARRLRRGRGAGVRPRGRLELQLTVADLSLEVGSACARRPGGGLRVDAVVGGGGLVQLPALLIGLPGASVVQVAATNKLASFCGTSISAATYVRRIRPDPRPSCR